MNLLWDSGLFLSLENEQKFIGFCQKNGKFLWFSDRIVR